MTATGLKIQCVQRQIPYFSVLILVYLVKTIHKAKCLALCLAFVYFGEFFCAGSFCIPHMELKYPLIQPHVFMNAETQFSNMDAVFYTSMSVYNLQVHRQSVESQQIKTSLRGKKKKSPLFRGYISVSLSSSLREEYLNNSGYTKEKFHQKIRQKDCILGTS